MKLKTSEYVIGCRIGETIYLNPHLKHYPELQRAILKHENRHTERISWTDLKLDLENEEIGRVRGEYYRFLLKHPKTLLSFFPFLKIGGKWTFDLGLLFIWTFAAIIGGVIILTL